MGNPATHLGSPSGRVLPLGEFTDDGDYVEGEMSFESTPKLSFGLGYAFVQNATQSRATTGTELSEARSFGNSFIDALFKYRGWSLAVEYLNRLVPNPIAGTETLFSGEGLSTQGGYLFRPDWEIAARHSILRAREASRSAHPFQTQWTLGLNHFFKGHRVKAQTDVSLDQVEGRADRWIGRVQLEVGI